MVGMDTLQKHGLSINDGRLMGLCRGKGGGRMARFEGSANEDTGRLMIMMAQEKDEGKENGRSPHPWSNKR